MPSYQPPVADALFVLNDVLKMDQYGHLAGFADASPDIVAAVLEEAAKLASGVLQPLNLPGDQEGCRRADDGSVSTPKGFKAAFEAYAGGGWISRPSTRPLAARACPMCSPPPSMNSSPPATWPCPCIRA